MRRWFFESLPGFDINGGTWLIRCRHRGRYVGHLWGKHLIVYINRSNY